MADFLQSQYSSVFSNADDLNAKTPLLNPQLSQPLIDFSFTTADIQKAIEEIDENSSCGDKYIPAKVLRQCRANLSYPIYIVWEESLNQGKILSPQLKDQIISPIHKKGSRADPAECCPISLMIKDPLKNYFLCGRYSPPPTGSDQRNPVVPGE